MSESYFNNIPIKYPELFADAIYSGVGDGWAEIVEELCADICKIDEAKRPNFGFLQIKEKLGELTIYTQNATDEIKNLLKTTELRASTTCEYCGISDGTVERSAGTKHWVKTLCTKCRQPFEAHEFDKLRHSKYRTNKQ